MVPQQVLRVAVATAIVAAASGSARAQERAERVVIIDLRKPKAEDRRATREALEKALGKVHGVALIDDAGLRAALAGEPVDARGKAANEALDAAQAAFGKLDCAEANARAGDAIIDLAAMQARGDAVTGELASAYVYLLLCADKFGDVDGAMAAARRLRKLGAPEPPPGVSPQTWSTYPEIDAASNVSLVELRVETEPAAAEVWIDHERAGLAPHVAVVNEGEHIVAVSAQGVGAAQELAVTGPSTLATLAIAGPGRTSGDVAARIARWRGGKEATPKELGKLLDQIGVRVALVLAQEGKIEVWGVGKKGRPAQLLGSASRAIGVGAIINERVSAWDRGPGIDPDRPLLRETPEERARRADGSKAPQKWWVYASIIGAVVVGSVIIIGYETAQDRQRIEVSIP